MSLLYSRIDWDDPTNLKSRLPPTSLFDWSNGSSHLFLLNMYKHRILNLQLSTNYEIYSRHISAVFKLALDTQDYNHLLSGGFDGVVSLYDLESWKMKNHRKEVRRILSFQVGSISNPSGVCGLQWYPTDKGALVVALRNGSVNLYDTNDLQQPLLNFQMPSNSANCASISPYNSLIAVGTNDVNIRLCDPLSGDYAHVLSGHTDSITCVDWDPHSSYQIASASSDGVVKLWDIRKGNHHGLLLSLDWRQNHSIDYSSNRNSSFMKNIPWNRDQLSKAHEGRVNSIRFTRCGRYLITSGNDMKIKLWNSMNGNLLPIHYTIGCKSELGFNMTIADIGDSPSNDLLLFPRGQHGDLAILPIHSLSGKPIKLLHGHTKMINDIVFRRPYQQVITCSLDKMVYIWDCDPNRLQFHREKQFPSEEHQEKEVLKDDDNWSVNDDDSVTLPPSKSLSEASNKVSNFFIPPIVQHYINSYDTFLNELPPNTEFSLSAIEDTSADEKARLKKLKLRQKIYMKLKSKYS